MLIQPILAYGYQGDFFSIFNGVYDWNPLTRSWWTSEAGYVAPGSIVDSYVKLTTDPKTGGDAYEMFVGARGGFNVTSLRTVDPGQATNESWAMFVLEHQPNSCEAYPPNNAFTFEGVTLEVDGHRVEKPAWQAEQERPACDSEAVVVDASTISITWDTSAKAEASALPAAASGSLRAADWAAQGRESPPPPRKWLPAGTGQ